MKDKKVTTKKITVYIHRLNQDFHYKLFGENTKPKGHTLCYTATPEKRERYSLGVCTELNKIEIPKTYIDVYKKEVIETRETKEEKVK